MGSWLGGGMLGGEKVVGVCGGEGQSGEGVVVRKGRGPGVGRR